MVPGVSLASVAMAHGINANLLRRWTQEMPAPARSVSAYEPRPSSAATFMPLALPEPRASGEVRIELRRGTTTVSVAWPAEAAAECAVWMRELLR
jgi:transposase